MPEYASNIEGHTREPFWACYRGECSDEDCYEGECCVECTSATSEWGTLCDAKRIIFWPCDAVARQITWDGAR